MTCLSCRGASRHAVCTACRRTLRPASDRIVGDGVVVRSAFDHEGAARALVHRLKYEAVAGVAARLAAVMAPLLPTGAANLVPIPRARLRHLEHGVDPAVSLATALGRATGMPVSMVLGSGWWTRRRAGPAGRRRGVPRYRLVTDAPIGAVLVDDVVTTGTTIATAARVTGARWAVTATAGHSTLTQTRAAP